jgi:hypothetical protein
MFANSNLSLNAEFAATIIRHDGTHRDVAPSSKTIDLETATKKLKQPMSFFQRMWHELRSSNLIPLTLGFAAFLQMLHSGDMSVLPMTALVTTSGIGILAADFVSGAGTHISAFNYHDLGTGTTAAAISDTALVTPAGFTRQAGTQSTPSAGQYRSVATVTATGSAAIAEWGLFSAAIVGTLFDRRVFAPVNLASGDSLQTTYTLTCVAGGA